jgi:ABC-type transport system involved in multi-copper enzyme maturation permease subunit
MSGVLRVFDLSLGAMLWSRRTLFMALVVASPIALAIAFRVGREAGEAMIRINGVELDEAGVFGMLIWGLFLRFIIPVLGVFYGTSLIADEVEEKTITYLFSRPVRRGAVLAGKYLAYLACTTFIVLPAVMCTYLLLVPFGEMAASFGALVTDLAVLLLGLAAYGALFALVGTLLKRPLVVGLVFAFGWEQLALLMPGYLRQFTLAHYLQALVPHALPPASDATSFLQALFTESPSAPLSVAVLLSLTVLSFGLAFRVVEQREYVLEQ